MSVTTLSVQKQMELLFLPILQEQQNKLNQLEIIVQNQQERIDKLESKGSYHQQKKSIFQKHSSMDSQFIQPALKQLNMLLLQKKDKQNQRNPPKSESLKEDTHIYKEIMKNQELKKKIQPVVSLDNLQKENSIQRRLSASPYRNLERASLTSQQQSIKKMENKPKTKDIKPLSISMINQVEKPAIEIQIIHRIHEVITHNSIWKLQCNIKLKKKILFIRYDNPSNIYVFTYFVENIILYIIDIYGSILRKQTLKGHLGPIYSININKSHTMVISASDDLSIGVWKINQQQDWFRDQTLVGHKSPVTSVQFNSQEDLLISGGHDNAILIWGKDHYCQWTLYQILEKNQGGLVTSICINIQSNIMASGGCDNSIIIWCKTNEWKYRQTLVGHTKSVLCVNFNQTSKILVSGSRDMTIRLWVKKNRMPYSCIQVINSHTSWVKLVKFQDRILYTGSSDGSIKLFIQQGDGSWYCSQRLQRQEQIVGIEFESSLMIVGSLSRVSYYQDIKY